MPRLSKQDLESIQEEIKEWSIAKDIILKILDCELNENCREMLKQTAHYLDNGIEVRKVDYDFMSKEDGSYDA